ncbi:MAG: hypothetical protein Rubg2KO_05310 [Rubricoccaceae bacterium]
MIEKKLLVGRYLRVPPLNLNTKSYTTGEFVTQTYRPYTIQQSTGGGLFSGPKTSDVVAGTGAKLHRNFQWLEYVAGAITEVDLHQGDVLTGPMSGCAIRVYRRGGVVRVGHVGTHDTDPVKTAASKKSWGDFARANQGDLISGFNPMRDWTGAFPTLKEGTKEGKLELFALVTTTQDLFTMAAALQSDAVSYRIAEIQQATPSQNLVVV